MTEYYSVGVDSEFETHGSPAEAASSASDTLELARDEAWSGGEWPEYAECIEYGILVPLGKAVEKKLGEHNSDYEILPIAREKRDESMDITNGVNSPLVPYEQYAALEALYDSALNESVSLRAQLLKREAQLSDSIITANKATDEVSRLRVQSRKQIEDILVLRDFAEYAAGADIGCVPASAHYGAITALCGVIDGLHAKITGALDTLKGIDGCDIYNIRGDVTVAIEELEK